MAVLLLFTGVFGMKKLLPVIGITGLVAAIAAALFYDDSMFAEYSNMFVFNAYAKGFSILCMAVTTLLFMLAPNFLAKDNKHKEEKYALMMFSLCGAICMMSFQNMVMLFLGIEILSIPLYILAASDKNDQHSNEAGMKYFLMGAFATGILLFGIAMIYGSTGSLDISAIGQSITSGAANPALLTIGILMLMIGMSFKISAAPFHFWSPDVYDGSPSLFTAFMSTVVKVAAFAAFFKLFMACFASVGSTWTMVLAIMAALTLCIANLSALLQVSFKRMMAYSSISHAGYLLLAILCMHEGANQAMFLYLVAYSIATVAAFTVFINLQQHSGRSDFHIFDGLGKRSPFQAVVMTIAMLSLAGIPLTAGFFGKYYLFSLSFNAYPWLVIIAILNSAVSIYYYFKVIVAMWMREADDEIDSKLPTLYDLVLVITGVLIVAIGVYPSLILSL
jgi:NADH-quinone oxidoreductase subunit N